jgi:hypothetical protein
VTYPETVSSAEARILQAWSVPPMMTGSISVTHWAGAAGRSASLSYAGGGGGSGGHYEPAGQAAQYAPQAARGYADALQGVPGTARTPVSLTSGPPQTQAALSAWADARRRWVETEDLSAITEMDQMDPAGLSGGDFALADTPPRTRPAAPPPARCGARHELARGFLVAAAAWLVIWLVFHVALGIMT